LKAAAAQQADPPSQYDDLTSFSKKKNKDLTWSSSSPPRRSRIVSQAVAAMAEDATSSHPSRYVKLTKDQDAPTEDIRPGELNQPVHVPQVRPFTIYLSPLRSE
jgi:hypothetical protein